MMKIKLTDIFEIDNPAAFKLHAARWNHEEQPLDVFVRSREDWFGWNTWRNPRNEFNRPFIFSLIDFYHEYETWLFGGAFEVLSRGSDVKCHSYKLKELPQFLPYVGRLKINMPKPSRGRAFYLEKHLNGMLVKEILQTKYSGQVFPGYEHINHDFSELEPIFRREKMDWKTALKNVKGVYLITDKSNGKRYVGSAYGEQGLWSRWSCYIGTGHGWNDELTKLIQSNGFEYAQKNFCLSLLEYRPMKTDDHEIIARESFWKEVMFSRGEFGYNKN